jgi:hypothetical protein
MKIKGAEVEDANEHLEITITKNDVRLGSLKNSEACAAARALCRQEGCDAALVSFSRAYIKKGGKWKRFCVPDALRAEIIAFDRGGTFEPGEYTLRPVAPALRLDAPRKPGRNAKSRARGGNGRSQPQKGNRPKRPYHVVSGVRKKMVPDWE